LRARFLLFTRQRPWTFGGRAAALLAGASFLTRGDGAAATLARPSFEALRPAGIRGIPQGDDAGEVASGALPPHAKLGGDDVLGAAAAPLDLGGGSGGWRLRFGPGDRSPEAAGARGVASVDQATGVSLRNWLSNQPRLTQARRQPPCPEGADTRAAVRGLSATSRLRGLRRPLLRAADQPTPTQMLVRKGEFPRDFAMFG
jgi:hypothetical protein